MPRLQYGLGSTANYPWHHTKQSPLALLALKAARKIACLMENPQHENVVAVHTVEDDVPRVVDFAAFVARLEMAGADALPEIGSLVASIA